MIEMRAIFQALPLKFSNDGDGKKQEWRDAFVTRLTSATRAAEAGRLPAKDLRFRAYTSAEALFDANSGTHRVASVQSSAFDATPQHEGAGGKTRSSARLMWYPYRRLGRGLLSYRSN